MDAVLTGSNKILITFFTPYLCAFARAINITPLWPYGIPFHPDIGNATEADFP